MEKQYGIQWREFVGRDGRLVTKEKWFNTEAERGVFVNKLSDKDGFVEFVAWNDPRVSVH